MADTRNIVTEIIEGPGQLVRLVAAIGDNDAAASALATSIGVRIAADPELLDVITGASRRGRGEGEARGFGEGERGFGEGFGEGLRLERGLERGFGEGERGFPEGLERGREVRVPCGTVPTVGDGQPRDVRSGFCFPDLNNGCNGSILANPADPKTEISLRNYYKRDSLFVNFEDTSYRDLAAMVNPADPLFKMEPDDLARPNQNVFNYRNFFLVDPSDDGITRGYLDNNFQNNIVRLRYAVGNCYLRVAQNLNATAGASPLELAEIIEARKTIGMMGRNVNWMICPAFFTYRMLPLKKGYKSCYEFNAQQPRGPGRRQKLAECVGIKYPVGGDQNAPDDVYVYTFVDSVGNYVTQNTIINGNVRDASNSLSAGDLPYDDDFFIFPAKFKNTVVCARYPDGILLFGYGGMLTPIPPFGTVVKKSKLNNNGANLVGYPDGELHEALDGVIRTVVDNARTGAYSAPLNAKTITIRGRPVQLDNPRFANLRELIIGAMAYIEIMRFFYDVLDRGVFLGGRNRITRNRRLRRRNKSVKQNKTRSKSKGRSRSRVRARARATSMLKTAKQQFHGGLAAKQPLPSTFGSTLGGGLNPSPYTQPNLAPSSN